ncbi:porin family protein [Flavihumibacter sp. R14]|nr:porin family protein [Flavihumibacter soli]
MNYSSAFRALLIVSVTLIFSAQSSAQVLAPGLDAGIHIGATKAFTDVTDSDINPSYGAVVQYNVTPFTFGNLEYSFGKLSREELDKYNKSYTNNFHRVTATANVSLGQLLNPDYRIAHYMYYNIYVGSGIGMIYSNISEPNALTHDGFGGITYKGADLTIPVNVGINFKLGSYLYPNSPMKFSVNLQHNFGLTEMLDGYDPDNSDNKSKDSFTTLNLGMKYSFGKKQED